MKWVKNELVIDGPSKQLGCFWFFVARARVGLYSSSNRSAWFQSAVVGYWAHRSLERGLLAHSDASIVPYETPKKAYSSRRQTDVDPTTCLTLWWLEWLQLRHRRLQGEAYRLSPWNRYSKVAACHFGSFFLSWVVQQRRYSWPELLAFLVEAPLFHLVVTAVFSSRVSWVLIFR